MATTLSPLQVHLDFHTSGDIPGIGADFNAETFARMAKEASLTSMTVFARCHHGYAYYPSKAFPERVHPHLANKNLLLEQIDALHAQGLKAPVYNTVQWDLYTAAHHPEWLIRKRDGAHEGGPFTEPGFYQSLCVNTGYWDFLAAQTRELMDILGGKLDGFFFDIVGIRPCLCSACLPMMKAQGIDPNDEDAVRAFAKETVDCFKARMSALVRESRPDATIFYNAGHVGPCTLDSALSYSHFELESLPSGGWGYLHFPVSARYARTLGIDCMGMTGKFHLSWGDFHSLKNKAALEFECFRMFSYGMAVSVGDQLEPGGTLNEATYKLIGQVFGELAERQAWARPSVPLVEAAVVTSEPPDREHMIPDSVLGASQMLEELALQFDIVDAGADLSRYKLVILPDDCTVDAGFQTKIDAYAVAGGAVIACHNGGANADGAYPACFAAKSEGANENYPDFIIAEGCLAGDLEPGNEYVVYKQGLRIAPIAAETILEARAPYFPRRGDKFCSHSYTPSAKGAPYPAALRNGRVILFAHPLFTQYRDNAPLWCKRLLNNAVDRLLPDRLVRHDGPSTLAVSLLGQPECGRVNVHLLSYIPVRKSATIDLVEERTVLRDVRLEFNLPSGIKSARLVPEDIPLVVEGGAVTVPEVNGYAIVELTVEDE